MWNYILYNSTSIYSHTILREFFKLAKFTAQIEHKTPFEAKKKKLLE